MALIFEKIHTLHPSGDARLTETIETESKTTMSLFALVFFGKVVKIALQRVCACVCVLCVPGVWYPFLSQPDTLGAFENSLLYVKCQARCRQSVENRSN